MRTVFLGNHAWSVPTLEALASAPEVEVALVVTNPPRPAPRGARLRPTPVAEAGRGLGLDVVEAEGVREGSGSEALRASEPDLLVVVAYGQLLPAWVLDLPQVAPLNVHFSLLPRWRGAAPVQRAILAGDPGTGVTLMRMDQGLDTGPIVAQRSTPIGPEEDAGTLGDRLAALGAVLMTATIPALAAGDVLERPQDDERSTAAPSISPPERWIDWGQAAVDVDRRVRALSPRPGARTRFRGGDLVVVRTAIGPDGPDESGAPGTLEVGEDGVWVRAGEGRLRLIELVPAGRSRLVADAWVRGARIAVGERLG